MTVSTYRLAALTVVAVLALAGCSGTTEPAPTPTVTQAVPATLNEASTVDGVIAFVQAQGTMTADEVADAASKLNKLAASKYSDADYADLKDDLNKLTINAVQGTGTGDYQAQLVEITTRITELG